MALIAAAACAPVACAKQPSEVEIRYRVTVIADEKGIERKSSAVWGISLARPTFPLADSYNTEFRGDAIPLVLQDGAAVLVLIQSWFPESPGLALHSPNIEVGRIPSVLFRDHVQYKGGDDIEMLAALKISKVRTGELVCPSTGVFKFHEPAGSSLPTAAVCFRMAYLNNPRDKSSLREFDPACAYFQQECIIHINRVIVEVTDDPVTRPLTNVIPWIRFYNTKRVFDEMAKSKPTISEALFAIRR